MKIFLSILISFVGISSFAQDIHFLKTYGNSGYDFGRDIKQTLDTGYIATGSSSSFSTGTSDAFLLKVDSLGNFKWSYSYGGLGSDWGEKVVLASDSSFAVGGYTNSTGAGGFDFYLVRANIDGSPRWEKTYGGADWDKAYSLVQLPDSGFVIVGETYSYGAGNLDGYIVRTDKEGDTLWTKTWGGTEDDVFQDVDYDGDSLIIVGYTESFGAGDKDGLIVKLGLDGEIGFEQYIGDTGEDLFNSVMARDTFYMLGGSRSYHHYLECDCKKDFWLYKITNTGNTLIADTTWFGEQLGEDIIYDIALNPNNDMHYGGSTTSWGSVDISAGQTDAFLGKHLNNYYTAFDYVRNFGEQFSDDVRGLDYCYDKGIVGIGTMKFLSTGGYNMFIVKTDWLNSWPEIDVTTDVESEIITLSNDEISKQPLNIYPTITDGEITITDLNGIKKITVFNIYGSLIQYHETYDNTIDISNEGTGMYIIQVEFDTQIFTAKVFKN